MKKSRVTIRDVALVARVTPQTVSRAIRNAPEVSAETREKVLKVAAELNYVKNNSASSLRCGNSKLIVIVYDHLVNIYFHDRLFADLFQRAELFDFDAVGDEASARPFGL